MANNTARLDERLATLDEDEREIMAAATQPVELPTEEEQWWPYLVEYFGSEDAIFSHMGLDRGVFDQALALVGDVVGERRERRSAIRTNREKLTFMMLYMAKGVEILEGLRIARLLDRPHANHARKLLGIDALSRRLLVTFHHSIASFSNTASTKGVSATEEGWRYAAGFTNF